MFKKIASLFKEKDNDTKHSDELHQEEIAEDVIIDDFELEKELSFDVGTPFRFEVYVGNDENDVKLVNDNDFATVEEAREFAIKFVRDNDLGLFFIHEEVADENGNKTLTRYY